MRLGRLVLIAAGLASIAYMTSLTGVAALLEPVRTLSWRIAVVLVMPYAVVALLHTLGWRVLFTRAVSLRRLFAVRLAGEALNLGSASVGGEPVKVYLLRPAVPVAEASAAQVVEKTTITLGQVLFLAVGLGVACAAFHPPADFVRAMTMLLGIQIVAVAGFVMVQCIGLGGWALRVLRRVGLANGEGRAGGLARFDATLAASYRERWGAVTVSTLVHLLGWLAGSLEVYLVLRWFGVETSLAAALAIDALGTGIKFMAFAIPGALGVLEGGYMLVFGVFGLGSGLGLSFTLVRRLRMLAWSGAGLLILAWMRAAPAAARR
jgi:uncharacterized protein (TIRG00374 family)